MMRLPPGLVCGAAGLFVVQDVGAAKDSTRGVGCVRRACFFVARLSLRACPGPRQARWARGLAGLERFFPLGRFHPLPPALRGLL